MKKLISILLGICLVLSLSAIPAMAAPANLSELIEESFTRQASFAITENLNIPQALEDGTAITWESSNPNVISTAGVVTRQAKDTDVTLTASAAGATKEFNFTVIGKGKKVWYSENFNVLSTEVGAKLDNYPNPSTGASPSSDLSYGYNPATESDSGRIGFMEYTYNDTVYDDVSVQVNPLKPGDYSLRFYTEDSAETETSYQANANLMFPALTTDALPGGNVKLLIRVTSPETAENGATRFDFGFTGPNEHATYIGNLTWRRNLGSDITRAGQLSGSGKTMVSMTPENGYYSNLIEYDVDLNGGEGKITSATNGTPTTVVNTFTADATGKTRGLYLATEKTTAESLVYVDDVVIMTDEIDASTDAEGVEIYKALLTDAFKTEVADINNVDRDFSLDLVSVDGYSVSWVSSNESAIKIDSVNKKADVQLSEIIRPVTLTATIAKGEATETAAFNLTVVPYGSTIESYKAEGTKGIIDYTGYAREAEYNKNDPDALYLHSLGNATYKVVKDGITQNEYVQITNQAFFGYDQYPVGTLAVPHATYSVDISFGEVTSKYNRVANNTVEVLGGNGSVMAKLSFVFEYDKTPNYSKYIKFQSGTNEVIVKDPAIVPDVDEWINLQIVTNDVAKKYDVYINGAKINSKALDYPSLGTDKFYGFRFLKSAYTSSFNLDNIQVRVNDNATYANPGAELMNASIASFSDALAATGTNNSAITWAASGDAEIENGALVKTKAFGLGKAVATASVTTANGTLSRPSAIEYGTAIKEINNDGTKLTSVIYSAESAGKGYIALYNNEDRLLDVASFDVAAGTDVINFVNKALPTGYDSCKAFVWTSGLKPLGYVYP